MKDKQIPTTGELRAHLSKGDPNIDRVMQFYTGDVQLPLRAISYLPLRAISYLYALLNARGEFVAVQEYGEAERICSVSEAINIILDGLSEKGKEEGNDTEG